MFSQILRAFVAKAEASRGGAGATDALQGDAAAPGWSSPGGLGFVREFLRHFRAIGYQLVRLGDYERLDPFLDALAALRDVDLLDRARLDRAVAEARALQTYLDELFKQIGRRRELEGVPFARKEAADTLRIYLGAS